MNRPQGAGRGAPSEPPLISPSCILAAPLAGNTNVHGTAFAGSLYSISALCAWYTLVVDLRARGLDAAYTVVIQSADIEYKKPVTEPRIVARSELPDARELDAFLDAVARDGKASCVVRGRIMKTAEQPAANYAVKLCAFKPRARKPAATG